MAQESFFEELKTKLVGHGVSYRRLACDSLLVDIDGEPGDGIGVTIWFEPIWYFCRPERVLVGSMQVAEASDTKEAMAAVADEPMDPLLGRSIENIVIEPRTFDLIVTFQGDYSIKTFVSDPMSDESWHIRDNNSRMRLKGSPKGLYVVPAKPRS
jgi:hypothetical protein